ncbi:hypothetical protein V1511DRAFT_504977 [Dipodascopsis uninucleata]
MAFSFKQPLFFTIWIIVSSILVFWDATYMLLRPHSMPGGKLHFFWKPYALYGEIDQVYGVLALEDNHGFSAAQSILTLVEMVFNLIYLYLVCSKKNERCRLLGAFIGLLSATSCFSKTCLYMLSEVCSGNKYTGHNPWDRYIFLYVLPSSPWILVNFYMMIDISKQLIEGLVAVPSSTEEEKKIK